MSDIWPLHAWGTVLIYCPVLKKSKGNSYLKILHFSKLFVADASVMKKK